VVYRQRRAALPPGVQQPSVEVWPALVLYVRYTQNREEGSMDYLNGERGFIFGAVLTGLAILFLLAGGVGLLAHNVPVAGALLVIGIVIYPVVSALKRKFMT
jgi:hypothetical protein